VEEKILLVDDNVRLLKSIRRVFRDRYSIDTAEGGEAALKKIAADGPYAVIISDLQMPRMDGIEFLKLVQREGSESIHIMLSGHASLETAMQAVNEGLVYKFFTKPMPHNELAEGIEAALQEYRLHQAQNDVVELPTDVDFDKVVEDNVTRDIENATQAIKYEAVRALLDIQKRSELVMLPVMAKDGSDSSFHCAEFDMPTITKISKIKNILGSSPEVLTKIDILMLGKAASYIYSNIEKNNLGHFVIDIHFSTLYHRRYLEMYIRICRSLVDAVRSCLSLKVVGISDDILVSRAGELISRLRPFANNVFVDLSGMSNAEQFVKGMVNTVLVLDADEILIARKGDRLTEKRKLLNSLSMTSNQVLFKNCEPSMIEDLVSKIRVDYYQVNM